MSSDLEQMAIRAQNLSKRYALFQSPLHRVRQSLAVRANHMLGRPPVQRSNEFDALKNVSFEVARGQTVGIVGRNGSGKSTLLQLICGTLTPTSGTVEVNGRIAALLELGAGFNPDYTGRDNVFINSAILGLSRKETEEKLDDILAFADIGQFIDQPVKTYSSGMYVRLAFATAINTDPDILIVDEALAVGDEAFQRKCFARLRQIQDAGATILFVSHSAGSVIELCDNALMLDHGELLTWGEPKQVTSQYQRLVHARPEKSAAIREEIKNSHGPSGDTSQPDFRVEADNKDSDGAVADTVRIASEERPKTLREEALEYEAYLADMLPESTMNYATHGATISDVHITNLDGEACNVLVQGETYIYTYTATFEKTQQDACFAMLFKTVSGVEVTSEWSHVAGEGLHIEKGETVKVRFPFVNTLLPGSYFCNAGVFTHHEGDFHHLHRIIDVYMFKVAPYPLPRRFYGIVAPRPHDAEPGVEVERLGMD